MWVGGQPVDVFLAGDDTRAKSQVAEQVRDIALPGLPAVPVPRDPRADAAAR